MNSYTVRILTFLLSLFVLITFASQVYLALQDDFQTETALLCNADETIDFKGVFARNEKVIEYSGAGVINYPYPDGSKIARNSPVAEVYSNINDITANQKIEEIDSELEQLKRIQNKGTAESVQPEYISKLIKEKYQSVAQCIEDNDIKKLKSENQELLTLLNIMQIITGKENDYQERTTFLNNELESYNAQKDSPISSIYTEESGYFVSRIDGYEGKIDIDNVDNISESQIDDIIMNSGAQFNQGNSVGKIISGYEAKIAGVIDNTNNNLFENQMVIIKIQGISDNVKAKIEKISAPDENNKSVIVLACDDMSPEMTKSRTADIRIVLCEYEGIKVPRNAIRFIDGQKGVYVTLGENFEFKKLDIIYENDQYVVSKKQTKDGYLELYDDVITGGLKESDIDAYCVSIKESIMEDTATESDTQSSVVETDNT